MGGFICFSWRPLLLFGLYFSPLALSFLIVHLPPLLCPFSGLTKCCSCNPGADHPSLCWRDFPGPGYQCCCSSSPPEAAVSWSRGGRLMRGYSASLTTVRCCCTRRSRCPDPRRTDPWNPLGGSQGWCCHRSCSDFSGDPWWLGG